MTPMPAQKRRRPKRELYVTVFPPPTRSLSSPTGADARQAIPEGFPQKPKGLALVSDLDGGANADVDLPPPSKAGAVELRKGEDGKPLANGVAGEDDETDWGKTGWEPRFGWPKESAHEGESLLDHATWVESQLSEQFFGGRGP